MTDEVPRTADDTALVSDREIERLAEVKTMLEPTIAEVNLRSRENVCLNLCTFTDALYLSYPLAADGSEPALSEIFRYVDGLFCDRKGLKLQAEKSLPEEDFRYRCSALSPAIRELLLKRERLSGTKRIRGGNILPFMPHWSASAYARKTIIWKNARGRYALTAEISCSSGKGKFLPLCWKVTSAALSAISGRTAYG